jgi:uncharacterized protein
MTVCIDTNVLVGMFGRNAPWLQLRQALLDGRILWALSNEIVLEYEEIFGREMGETKAASLLQFIDLLEATRGVIRHVSPSYRFQTIPADADDNKFADCAIVANAHFIITEDRHFRPLVGAGYKVQPIAPEVFIEKYLAKRDAEESERGA